MSSIESLQGVRAKLQQWARGIMREVHALWLAARDPRTPWYAKWLALAVAAYAVSPIDLIPDVIPVLGFLDDLLLVPLGVWLVLRMIPADVMAEHRAAAAAAPSRPASKTAAMMVVLVWIACATGLAFWLLP